MVRRRIWWQPSRHSTGYLERSSILKLLTTASDENAMDRQAAQIEQQPPTPEQLQQQADSQKITSAIQVGLAFLGDETVNGPIKYSDGISDLKWLLRMLISGEYGINTDPNQLGIEGKAPTKTDTP